MSDIQIYILIGWGVVIASFFLLRFIAVVHDFGGWSTVFEIMIGIGLMLLLCAAVGGSFYFFVRG